MNLTGGVIGGLIAGMIGAAAWAALAYFGNMEHGILAWIIGGLVGFGTAVGSRGGSIGTALIAVIITVLAICGGKYAAIQLSMNKAFGEDDTTVEVTDELLISIYADEDIAAKVDNEEQINWPAGANIDAPQYEADYPEDIWAKALKRWEDLGENGQDAFRKDHKQRIAEGREAWEDMKKQMANDSFFQSFSGIDVIFFLLAMFTAWQIAINDEE